MLNMIKLIIIIIGALLMHASSSPLPEDNQSNGSIDVATPIEQDLAQVNRIVTQSSLLLSFPDRGPQE